MVRIVTAAALFAVAGAANAGLGLTHAWVEIDNSVSPVTGNSPAVDPFGFPFNPDNYRTFRLFIYGEGLQVTAINMGTAANPNLSNDQIYTDGGVFNHGTGGNVRTPGLEGFSSSIYFDTYLAIGNLAPGNIGIIGGSASLGAAGTDFAVGQNGLRATWFAPPGEPVTIGAGGMMLLQVTVTADATFLGGSFSRGEQVFNSRIEVATLTGNQLIKISNAIPTPGAAALLGLGGLVAIRRRR